LQIVSGVPPSTRGVNRCAGRSQITGESSVLVHIGREINLCALIIQMPSSGAQRRGNKVRSIALVLVEGQRVGERRGIETGRDINAERGRGCRDGSAYDNVVRP